MVQGSPDNSIKELPEYLKQELKPEIFRIGDLEGFVDVRLVGITHTYLKVEREGKAEKENSVIININGVDYRIYFNLDEIKERVVS